MRAISFAWTSASLVTGNKTVTRREWDNEYAIRFLRGDLVQAYDRQARFGGKPIAIIRLTESPRFTGDLPEEDFKGEGFEFDREHGIKVDGLNVDVLWRAWGISAAQGKKWWVVRFKVIELTDHGKALAAAYKTQAKPLLGGAE